MQRLGSYYHVVVTLRQIDFGTVSAAKVEPVINKPTVNKRAGRISENSKGLCLGVKTSNLGLNPTGSQIEISFAATNTGAATIGNETGGPRPL